ncbi:S46 family peptidase [Telmatocola sphagniphila]|uniref:Dipeptidyl-peptidase n=1 Tax=Telmatocola sphagniphila TaxID=1123043 RepID=A0A8E6B3Y8_9BACT|nr:S46 family peptidase [Telmatocola sphagniphila]QVL31276.1 S46 family peptidase [Telmatocola sphagniphila]
MTRFAVFTLTLFVGLGGITTMPVYSDEGMWLLNEPPTSILLTKYNFELTPEWLENARLSSIRFNNGGSGSFLSADGLIITNHHIGADALQKLSNKDRNLFRDGFYAKKQSEELKCNDLELNVLQEIVDVTQQVNDAVKPNMSPAEASAARRAAMSAIEKESTEKTKLRSDIVTLYQGGAYHLYRYKKYVDVRLVFAPEENIAHFGGDVDNFEYPRFCLDICFFRAYENDKPAQVKNYFKFNPNGPVENSLVFVTGHPGTTNRLETYDKLIHRRDVTLPINLSRLRMMEATLTQYSEKGPDERRQANNDLRRVANSRKAFSGQYAGLLDPTVLEEKKKQETNFQLRVKLDQGEEELDKFLKAQKRIADIQKEFTKFEKEYSMLERGDAFTSELFTIARHIVRLAEETAKPNSERLREYRDSNLESLKLQLFSPAPIHKDLEIQKLTASLTFFAEVFGRDAPIVQKILGGANPQKRATSIINRCKLFDPEFRKELVSQGVQGLDVTSDDMVQLARMVDADARTFRTLYEEEVEEPERQAFSELAKLRFKAFGKTVAPDATFTLRIAFGTVKGYETDAKENIPFHTTFEGLYSRATKLQNREPFELPKRWLEGKSKLDLKTPFNFVSTADTIGGNSGSPVLNEKGEFIGINFDRNRYGLVRNFLYTDVQARHIAVHSKGILEALKKLYDCQALVDEITR